MSPRNLRCTPGPFFHLNTTDSQSHMKLAPTVSKRPIYQYSSDHQFLAIVQSIANAQRITLWNTSSVSVILDHNPPINTCITSIAWGIHTSAKANSTVGADVLGICLSNGEIQILSIVTGAVLKTLSGVHSSSINDLVFVPNTDQAFSCGQDQWIVHWNFDSNTALHKFKATSVPKRLALTPTSLLVADSGVSVYSTQSYERIHQFHAHASDIVCMAVSDHIVLTAADRDRCVSVYDMHSKSQLPSLSLDHDVLSLVVADHAVAVLGVDGALALWASCLPSSDPPKPSKKKSAKRPKFSARVPDSILDFKSLESGERIPVTSATFSMAPHPSILLTRGVTINPDFETLIYMKGDQLIPTETMVRSTQFATTGKPAATKRTGPRPSVTVLHAADTVLPAPRLPTAPQVNGHCNVRIAKKTDCDLTLSERVAQLQVAPARHPTPLKQDVIDATSLHVTLAQALHSNDKELLESVFNAPVLTSKTIQSTVQNLSSVHVITLLQVVMDRFMRSHGRASVLVDWIKAILTAHMGYLMTVPDLVSKLAAFHHVLESRVEHGTAMLKLQGRLELGLAQVSVYSRAAAAGKCFDSACVVYDEAVDGEEEDVYEDMVFPANGPASTLRHVRPRATARALEALSEELTSADVTPLESENDDEGASVEPMDLDSCLDLNGVSSGSED